MTPQLLDLRSFVTLCYARFDLVRQQLSFVDCGHTPILHYRCAAGDCVALKGENLPVGIRASEEYHQITTAFGPGDRFLFYSDGVTEAQDPTEGYYGDKRLTGLLCRHASCTPHELIEHLRADVNCFAASESLADDLTCLAVAVSAPAHSFVL
jgi:phosphoserine phosphatase RsbU/P